MQVKVVTVKAGRMSLGDLDFGGDFLLDVLLGILLDVLLNILLDVLLNILLDVLLDVLLDILLDILLDVLLLGNLDLLDLLLAFNDDLGLPVWVLLLIEPNGSPSVLKELDVALIVGNDRYPQQGYV